MTEIRTKDKLFLAVVVPAAAVAAYWYCWRVDVAKKVDSLAARSAQLVKAEDFDHEKFMAERELKLAEEALKAERAVPTPALKVVAKAETGQAEREREVLKVFREAGLEVVDSDLVAVSAGAEVLRATGMRPEPVTRRYVLDGKYPQVRRALAIFAERKMAVVVEKIEMSGAGRGRWKLEVNL